MYIFDVPRGEHLGRKHGIDAVVGVHEHGLVSDFVQDIRVSHRISGYVLSVGGADGDHFGGFYPHFGGNFVNNPILFFPFIRVFVFFVLF